VLDALEEAPAACLFGLRQIGKTTLALDGTVRAVYLDLEQDYARLRDLEFISGNHGLAHRAGA